MSKRQLIEAIRELNPTAQATFLSQFDEKALKQYLGNLKSADARTTRIGGWVRKPVGLRLVG